VVIDNDGRTDVTVWGLHDIAGTVINGVCRDVSASLSQNYPLFSRGRFMVHVDGLPDLILPSWPEPAHVIEDCRG